jgi:hydroxylaminobenzene mutase
MHNDTHLTETSRRLLRLGSLLFLLGLITGFLLPVTANPRMALSSHIEGVLNGMFLLVLGAIWHRLTLGRTARTWVFWLAVYGAFTNWATTLIASFLGAGGPMMPFAAAEHTGTPGQEMLIAFGLISLSVAMVAVSGIVIWGLRPVDA